MDHSRRAFLTATTGVAVASAGCLSRLNPWSGDGSDEDGESQERPSNNTSGTEENDTRTRENRDEPGNASGERSGKENTTNETTDTSEDEKKLHPDENETGIDEEQYNRSEKSEVVELPEDSVEVRATYHLTDDESGVIVTGDIKNVTTDPIDFVDLRVLYYNDAEEKIGEDFVVKRDFAAKQMKTFEVQTPITEIRGDVAAVGGIPIPQNYADS